jgi:hypothetical protein
VEEAVAQRLGFGLGQVSVQGELPQPGEQGGDRPAPEQAGGMVEAMRGLTILPIVPSWPVGLAYTQCGNRIS